MPKLLRRALPPILLLLFGAAASYYLCPIEQAAVNQQVIGYPNSVIPAYELRPWLLAAMLFMPFLTSIYYNCCGLLDRYTLRIFLNSFGICFGALFILIMLEDVQDNLPDFMENDEALRLMGEYYLIKLPALISFILPYTLMLGLLWALGKMSKAQEIVSMVQTGRSVTRIVTPLISFGFICTLLCLIFNYHWAPYADSQESRLLEEAKGIAASEARHVAFQNDDDTRHWYVGAFPADDQHGKPLKSVNVAELKDGEIQSRIISDSAVWDQETAIWTFEAPLVFDLSSKDITATKYDDNLTFDWVETPFQIINPGLKPHFLGIPELTSWLSNHRDHPLSDKRSYLTHWHYRLAQPFICMITILLAAPLGVVFSRRGVGGGIAVAIFLCAGMIFCSTVFPTLGESGYLSPIAAAWATNVLFTVVAMILFKRRTSGQPIYQTVKNFFTP
ncbi:LptF/LptG family permease [Rubritalea marina]|uniref:LptF/LptG family permease n=1 Tax=Rubritalea marina TaxID=361055 RepID=UPI00036A9ABD|nr:LptF/LptG family permease [Rubritalea marina]